MALMLDLHRWSFFPASIACNSVEGPAMARSQEFRPVSHRISMCISRIPPTFSSNLLVHSDN